MSLERNLANGLHQNLLAKPTNPFLTQESRGGGDLHAGLPHDLDELEAEGGDVVLDLVDVVLRHALVLRLLLLLRHVTPHQVLHYALQHFKFRHFFLFYFFSGVSYLLSMINVSESPAGYQTC